MLPYVKIHFAQGALGSAEPMDDGVAGLVANGVAVATKFSLNTPYLVNRLGDLAKLGITDGASDANATIYKAVKEFYTEAPEGTKLWILASADTDGQDDLVDVTKTNNAKRLIEAANGSIRILFVAVKDPSEYEPVTTSGIDGVTRDAITNAQALAEWATENLFAPLFVILEGRHYTGTAATLVSNPINQGDDNRVCVIIGDTITDSAGAAVGLVAGRCARIPVQRSIARVRTGSINATAMYIGSVAAELGDPATISDSGFICPRTFVGKSGYFWSDDKLATSASDDYAIIPRRRVIDKAYRIAYQTLVNEISEEVPVTDEGKISAPVVKSIQTAVESAIINNMTSYGNLGNDPGDANDMGVECYINPDQNVVSTSHLEISLKAKPHGYTKYIDVTLGFKVNS